MTYYEDPMVLRHLKVKEGVLNFNWQFFKVSYILLVYYQLTFINNNLRFRLSLPEVFICNRILSLYL